MVRLTPRETTILKDIVKGLSYKEMAKKEFITIHTVKAHVASIIRKFNAKNRAEAVYLAVKESII